LIIEDEFRRIWDITEKVTKSSNRSHFEEKFCK